MLLLARHLGQPRLGLARESAGGAVDFPAGTVGPGARFGWQQLQQVRGLSWCAVDSRIGGGGFRV